MIMGRRISLFFVLCLTVSLVMVGCTQSSSSGQGKIKLRIATMFAGTDPATSVYKDALDEFVKAHSNVEIVDESMTSVGDTFRNKVKTDFASGDEPDVTFFFTGADAQPFIKSGKVMPLSDFFAKDAEWGATLPENVKKQVTEADGKIYAFPVTGFYEGLYVNKELFLQNNLELPTDWAKFTKAIEVFGQKEVVPLAGSLEESYYLIEHAILSAGGAEGHNSALKNGVDPTWESGLNLLKELYEKNAFSKDAATIKDAHTTELFANKKAAMTVNGSWIGGGLKDKENTVVLPFPVVPNGKAQPKDIIAGFSSGYYLSKKSYEDESKKGLALELIKFLTSKEMIRKFATANGGVPAADVQVEGLSPVTQSGHQLVKDASSLNLSIDAQIAPAAFAEIRTNVTNIVQGKKTAKEVLEGALKRQKEVTR